MKTFEERMVHTVDDLVALIEDDVALIEDNVALIEDNVAARIAQRRLEYLIYGWWDTSIDFLRVRLDDVHNGVAERLGAEIEGRRRYLFFSQFWLGESRPEIRIRLCTSLEAVWGVQVAGVFADSGAPLTLKSLIRVPEVRSESP